jgi:hypothetical protein
MVGPAPARVSADGALPPNIFHFGIALRQPLEATSNPAQLATNNCCCSFVRFCILAAFTLGQKLSVYRFQTSVNVYDSLNENRGNRCDRHKVSPADIFSRLARGRRSVVSRSVVRAPMAFFEKRP